jgi:hypothetical protein
MRRHARSAIPCFRSFPRKRESGVSNQESGIGNQEQLVMPLFRRTAAQILIRSFPRKRESRTPRQAVQFALGPRLRGDERECLDQQANTLRSFPRTNIGFTRCWHIYVRKSAKADLRWESSTKTNAVRFLLWVPACAGTSGEICEVPGGGGVMMRRHARSAIPCFRSFPRTRESSSDSRGITSLPWTPAIGVQSTPFFERLCAGVSGEVCGVPGNKFRSFPRKRGEGRKGAR